MSLRDDSLARLAGAHHHLPRESRSVALTFDDGPDPEFTPAILDVLADSGVRATFFCIGRHASAHPQILLRAKAEGHSIGTHSENHESAAGAAMGSLLKDYRTGKESVERILADEVRLFRPPQGRLSLASALALRRLGVDVWLWTLSTDDWRHGTTPRTLVEKISRVEPGDVVVFHDGTAEPGPDVCSDRSATVEAVRRAIDVLRGRGLALATL